MIIKGLDNGYLYTKDNDGRIFKSAYQLTDNGDINIDGYEYIVGSGTTCVEVDKTDAAINRICTLRNLTLTGEDDYFLCVGLPIKQYRTQKDKLIKMMFSYNNCQVYVKGSQFKFHINDVCVFPQGAAALLSTGITDGEFIVIDIGGLTIDIAWMEFINGNPVLEKCDTWYKGTQLLYSDIIHNVNNKYNLTLDPSYSEKILVNGLIYDGEKQDLSFLEPVKLKYIEPILTRFEVDFPAKTTQILLSGGGSSILQSALATRYKSVLTIPDGQFANAVGYKMVGDKKWGKYINNTSFSRR